MRSEAKEPADFQRLDCEAHPYLASAVLDVCHPRAIETASYIEVSQDLLSLACVWLSEARCSLEFGASGNPQAPLSLILRALEREVAWVTMRHSALPVFSTMDELPTERSKQRRWLRRRDAALGAHLRRTNSARVLTPTAALVIALSYALSDVGEAYMRTLEIGATEELLRDDDTVISTGTWTLLGCFYRRGAGAAAELNIGESFIVELSTY